MLLRTIAGGRICVNSRILQAEYSLSMAQYFPASRRFVTAPQKMHHENSLVRESNDLTSQIHPLGTPSTFQLQQSSTQADTKQLRPFDDPPAAQTKRQISKSQTSSTQKQRSRRPRNRNPSHPMEATIHPNPPQPRSLQEPISKALARISRPLFRAHNPR